MSNVHTMPRFAGERFSEKSMRTQRTQRLSAVAIWFGGFMIAVGFLLHPRILDIRAAISAIEAIQANVPMWSFIHWLTAAGFLLWVPGLLVLPTRLRFRSGLFSNAAVGLMIAALGLWLFVLIFEAVVLADWALEWSRGDEGVQADILRLVRPFWAFGLLLGYTAAFCIWSAIALWGHDIWCAEVDKESSATGTRVFPRWLGTWGMLFGVAAAVAVPFEVVLPNRAIFLLLMTGGPALLWSFAIGYFLWIHSDETWSQKT